MPDAISETSHHTPTASPGELALVLIGVIVVLIAQLSMTGAARLIWHPLWLDECITQILANDPSFTHEMSALANSVDTSPPMLFILLRPMYWATGALDPTHLRLFAAGAGILAIVGLYAICRRYFDRAAAAIAATTLLAHPAFIDQLFEARCYTIWLAATVWLCVFLTQMDRNESLLPLLAACAMAVIVATIHWFGVIVLGLIFVADLFTHRRRSARELIRRLIPALCAIIAFCICLPMLFKQRAGISVPTWMSRESLKLAAIQLSVLLNSLPITIILAILFVWRITTDRRGRGDLRELTGLAPLFALACVPMILIAISFLLQPASQVRYAIVGMFPLTGLAAAVVSPARSRNGRSARLLLLISFIAMGGLTISRRLEVTDSADYFIQSSRDSAAAIKHDSSIPLVYLQATEFFPVTSLSPKMLEGGALVVTDPVVIAQMPVGFQYQQQTGVLINRFYPRFKLAKISAREKNWHRLVVAPTNMQILVQNAFPGAEVYLRTPELFDVRMP